MSDTEKLKKVQCLNDYVAVLQTLEVPEGISVDQEALAKMSNEGVVVGAGPDADIVNVGDKVIFTRKKFLAIAPQSGGYGGKSIFIMRKLDLLVRLGKTDKYEFTEEEE